MTDKKARSKHIGYGAQREQCRLNKYTYTEKVNGVFTLFCNYPFPQPEHKKGLCKANTCTDMREIPADVVAADEKVVPTCKELDANTLADSGEGKEVQHSMGLEEETFSSEDQTEMPCPTNE